MPYPADLQHVQQSYIEAQADMRDARRQYGNILRFTEIEQLRLQQQANELSRRALTDPDAARRYQETIEQLGRTNQILMTPGGTFNPIPR